MSLVKDLILNRPDGSSLRSLMIALLEQSGSTWSALIRSINWPITGLFEGLEAMKVLATNDSKITPIKQKQLANYS